MDMNDARVQYALHPEHFMKEIVSKLDDPTPPEKGSSEKNPRIDGRSIEETRPVVLSPQSSSAMRNADGSASVKIGNTVMICGLKAELAPPSHDKPDQGFIVINVDLTPTCHARFRAGPPSSEAQSLSVLLNNIIMNEESSLFDLKSLCIEKHVLSWVIHADILCMNDDGCLTVCALASLVAALKNLRLPHVTVERENGDEITAKDDDLYVLSEKDIRVNAQQKTVAFQKEKDYTVLPVAATFAVYENGRVLVDPTRDEEDFSTALITIVLNKSTQKNDSKEKSSFKVSKIEVSGDLRRACFCDEFGDLRPKTLKGGDENSIIKTCIERADSYADQVLDVLLNDDVS